MIARRSVKRGGGIAARAKRNRCGVPPRLPDRLAGAKLAAF